MSSFERDRRVTPLFLVPPIDAKASIVSGSRFGLQTFISISPIILFSEMFPLVGEGFVLPLLRHEFLHQTFR